MTNWNENIKCRQRLLEGQKLFIRRQRIPHHASNSMPFAKGQVDSVELEKGHQYLCAPRENVNFNNTTTRLALCGNPFPRVEDSIKVGEWTRMAVMGKAKWLLGEKNIPRVLSGHELEKDNRHGHAFYLPEDADGDGHIDHILVYASDGLNKDCHRVFDRLTRLNNRQGNEWQVLLENIGETKTFSNSSALIGETNTWVSATPYLHPWFTKKKFTVEDQLRRECRERELPEIERLERLESINIRGRERHAIHFHRFRNKRSLAQPDTRGCFLRLHFSQPLSGPLALGFACHYGLGMFLPI